MTARLTVILAVALLCSACASQAQLRGRVVVSSMGPRPVTTLQVDSGGPYVLEGARAPELARLDGALVEVTGRMTDTPPHGGVAVERYVVLEIAGERPFVGRLDAAGTRMTLDDGSTLQLEGLPEAIRAGGAALIWVTGERAGDAIQVRSAGVIAPASPGPDR